ncbi:MAG: HAMP domain-containing sensor histidine kinase [Planctomycetota bacterium]
MSIEHDTRSDDASLEILQQIARADSAAAASRALFGWLAAAPAVQKALLFKVQRQPFELVLESKTDNVPVAAGLRIPFADHRRFTPQELAKNFAVSSFESCVLGAENDPDACLLIEFAPGDPGRRQAESVLELAKALYPRKDKAPSWITVRREVLAEVAKLKSEFLSGVSHELRTPLTLVLGSAYTLANRKNMPEHERDEFLAVILAEAKRLKGVIDSLFEMATLETGKRPIRTEPADLNLLVRRVVAEMRARIICSITATWTCTCRRRFPSSSSMRVPFARCCSTCSTMPPSSRPRTAQSR